MRNTILTFLLVLCICSASPLWAQFTAAGTIVGTVTDQSNAVVATAELTLTDTATGNKRTAKTNSAGQYTFTDVTPGRYKLAVSKQGFATAETAAAVTVGLTNTMNFALQIGATNTIVEVQSNAIELQTTNAVIGNEINGVALDSLPSLNRDVSTFVELQPGVSPDGSVAGTMVDQSSFQLDGGNNTNDMDGSMSVYTNSFAGDPTGGVVNGSLFAAAGPTGVMPTPADSVEEFKVNTAGQTADFNSSSGAQVQMVTRRGGNAWHGSLYEYYLDNNFSANTWDNNFTNQPVPDWHRSRFGFRVGGPILPKMLGGKTYIFVNYEGYRWPDSEQITRPVPSPAMRLGLLTFGSTTYNLNPYPVTYNGTTYAANQNCNLITGGACDPVGVGINPTVQQMWNKYMPLPNSPSCLDRRCDGVNVQDFTANLAIPQTSNFGVARVDHDFGDKWHFNSSYRYFKLLAAVDSQVDIGGFFPGDKLGVPSSQSSDPQTPWYYVAGLTTNISSNFTNDFHYSFLRNWWQWGRAGDTPQFPALGGALEPFGEDATQTLGPYNVNTQQTRRRFWDGKDHYLRDDLSLLKGNHLFQFGGAYQHNFNWHQRTDNGGGINYQPVYQLGTKTGPGITMTGFTTPSGSSSADFGRDYAAMMGIVSISQQVYTRTGSNLALNPPLTPAFDQSTIPYYNVYFSDTWHMKPSFTLTYGLGWTLEMPPVETSGKQIELVDQSNQIISTESYLHSREQAALQGQVYNPIVGFNLVGNTENGRKYPYDPFYAAFSPRIAGAWNPKPDSGILRTLFGNGDSVIRGGYGRIYGRLNGVDLVLVPLLGTGLLQPVECSPLASGSCAGIGSTTPATAWRVGVNGNIAPLPAALPTLPQPLFPGINGVAAGAGEALDPQFRPNHVDTFNLSIQRQLSRSMTVEAGYIGRLIHNEYQPININSVPYMMTMGGQRFDKAYANTVLQYCGGIKGLAGGGCAANAAAVTPQPFFETALAGTGYCTGFANCTQAVVANEGAHGTGNLTFANVWSLYSDLDSGVGCPVGGCSSPLGGSDGFNFPRSMMNTPLPGAAPCPGSTDPTPCGANGQLTSGVGVNTSVGYGNYNAAFASLKMGDWHGLTAQSNFTWSKALNTGATYQATSADTVIDPFNLRTGYGVSGADRKFVYNMFFIYQPPFYKGQHGIQGHLLGGWTFAPILTAGTGAPMISGTINGGGQAFGEGDSQNFLANGESENAIPIVPLHGGVHYSYVGQTGPSFPNFFADPTAAYNSIRQPILGYDKIDGGWGFIRGLGYWNMDLSVKKQFNLTERFNLEAQVVFSNIFNHVMFYDPGFGGIESNDYLDTSSVPPDFSSLPGQGNTPRTMEFGIRLNF